ncbi:MAG TPA: hypothetical protein VFG79_05885 [Solirubrobacter sp.]|nr:hypothetical protein [Solirubrobacter sp.]
MSWNGRVFEDLHAGQTEWGQPLVDSTFTLALVTGQSVTIYSDSEVLEVRESEVAAERRRRHRGHPVRYGDAAMATWEDVRAIGLKLPGVVEGLSYGTP